MKSFVLLFPFIQESFLNYDIVYYSEHEIITAENKSDKMKFVFSLYEKKVLIDQYYRSPKNNELFWSEPIQLLVTEDFFTLEHLEKLRLEFQLKHLFNIS